MKKAKLSPAKAAQIKRHDKICALYEDNVEYFDTAVELYNHIALRVGCGFGQVVRVLQNRGIITPKGPRN